MAVEQAARVARLYLEAERNYLEANARYDEHGNSLDAFCRVLATSFENAMYLMVTSILAWDPGSSGVDPVYPERCLLPARGIIYGDHLFLAAADFAERINLLEKPHLLGDTDGDVNRMHLLTVPLASIVDLNSREVAR